MTLRFRPPLWAWIGVVPMVALLAYLGTWQMQRGQEKTAIQAVMDASMLRAPVDLDATAVADESRAEHVRAAGSYRGDHQLLLDNQSHEGAPGYHAWTPLQLADGSVAMVDRGWLPQAGDRSHLPDIAVGDQARVATGLWRPLPRPGMRMGADDCPAGDWPRVAQYPTIADLRCLYGARVLDGVLLLDPSAADGYVRDWRISAGFPPQRHYAYAAQWYLFAAVLLFFFVKLNLRRSA